jgi:hypothetical protein
MVEVPIIVLTLITAIASLGAIIMFVMGVCALSAGRLTLCADRLRGRAARASGAILVAVLPASIVVLALLGAPWGVDWRRGPQNILIPTLATAIVVAGILGAFRVRARARASG